MRDALLKSFIRVLIVWFVLLFFYWGMQNSEIGVSVYHLLGKHVNVTALNALAWLWYVVYHWSLPVLGIALLMFFLGYQATHLYHWNRIKKINQGAVGDPSWRGMNISLGYLPHPTWEMKEPEQEFDWGPLKNKFNALPATHQEVLSQTLSVLANYPAGSVFVGAGHTDSLYEHTLNVLEPLWSETQKVDPLLPLLAAAHDMGKIRAFIKTPDGRWKRNGWHDEWSARLFSGLPGYWNLPAEDQKLALLALRYGHKFNQAPILPIQQTQRLVRLHEMLEGADRAATAEEKKIVMEANAENMPEFLTRAFLEAITETLEFYRPGMPKGKKASIWRRRSRLYISEPALREALLEHLPENVAAAIETTRKPREVAPITQALFEALRLQGWLVEALPEPGTRTESDGPAPLMIARPPLWNIRSGTLNLNGIMIVNIPVEEQYRLQGECPVPILTLCPLYDSQGKLLNTKGLFIPAEFLAASESENGQPMKAMEDAESIQHGDPIIKPETEEEKPSSLEPEPEETKKPLSAEDKAKAMMGMGTGTAGKRKPTKPRANPANDGTVSPNPKREQSSDSVPENQSESEVPNPKNNSDESRSPEG